MGGPGMCISIVKEARSKGLKVPVVLMGYCNPFIMYTGGVDKLGKDCQDAGVSGFIMVDLPVEEATVCGFRRVLPGQKLALRPVKTMLAERRKPGSSVGRDRLRLDAAGPACPPRP